MKIVFREGSSDPIEAVLKLYDRRFAARLRSLHYIEQWHEVNEIAYHNYVLSGEVEKFIDSLDEEDPSKDSSKWSYGQCEAFLHDYCVDMFNDEVEVYHKLQDCQGGEIPVLLGSVKLKYPVDSSIEEDNYTLFDINGLLLEHIPGITFAKIGKDNLPRESWQDVVDQAIRITHIFSDHDILNEDVRGPNILVTPDSTKECGHRTVMIDFGYVRFRNDYKSDLAWGRTKHAEDEEGSVGREMALRFQRKYGFELEYTPSDRYKEYAEPGVDDMYT